MGKKKKEIDMSHSVTVALLMYEIALKKTSDVKYAQEMHTLGMLHDIGKMLSENISRHSEIGGEHLRKVHYKHWLEVACHSDPFSRYNSKELELLCRADMCVMQNGKIVSPYQRLADIEKRYGKDSIQAMLSQAMILKLFISNSPADSYWAEMFEEYTADKECSRK